MQLSTHKLALIALLFTPFVAFSEPFRGLPKPDPATAQLKKEIENILVPKRFRDLSAGILAVSLDKKTILYQKNADKLLIPASVNKLFTAYVALKRLGVTAKFKTGVYAVSPIRKGELLGNLYLKGGGDPLLVSERMWMLVNHLQREGIRIIKGDLVGDASYFDKERTPTSRPVYLRDQAYNAPVGALSFNFNTTTIYVKPGNKVGAPPVYYTDPENAYIEVVNQAKTGKPNSKYSLRVTRLGEVKGDVGDTVLLRGSLPMGGKELRYYKNIANPTLYTCHMFKNFMERRGVRFTGNVLEGTVPKNARRLIDFESLPMWQIVWGLNKFSNNFVADQILKKVGAEMWGPPGNLQKGLLSVEELLEQIGIKRDSYKIADGSGLTRKSSVSARQIVRLLTAAYQDFSISAEFMASLGIAGGDGTLGKRMTSAITRGQVRGKTGSLNGVSSLAGYTKSLDGENIAFAILLNDPKQKYGRMANWVDQIATAFRRFKRN